MSYQATPEILRALAFGSIGTTYAKIGTPLLYPSRILIMTNNTDADMYLSIDGVNDYFFLALGSYKSIDINANKTPTESIFSFPVGTQFYVRYASGAPTKNDVYIETLYGLLR